MDKERRGCDLFAQSGIMVILREKKSIDTKDR